MNAGFSASIEAMVMIAFGFVAIAALGQISALSVRVVDPLWLPIPGIEVRLVEVASCRDIKTKVQNGARDARTKQSGVVEFSVVAGHAYVVEAGGDGNGFEKVEQCIDVAVLTERDTGNPQERDPAYVHLRVRPDPRLRYTLLEPALPSQTRDTSLGLDVFSGVYVDGTGQAYDVQSASDGPGLEVGLPDGRTLLFASRRGSTFDGPDGILSFRVVNRKVVSLSFVPKPIVATVWKRPL